jgi:hypothetical protein
MAVRPLGLRGRSGHRACKRFPSSLAKNEERRQAVTVKRSLGNAAAARADHRVVQVVSAPNRARFRRDGGLIRRRNAGDGLAQRLLCSGCGSRKVDMVTGGVAIAARRIITGKCPAGWPAEGYRYCGFTVRNGLPFLGALGEPADIQVWPTSLSVSSITLRAISYVRLRSILHASMGRNRPTEGCYEDTEDNKSHSAVPRAVIRGR